MGCLYAGLQTDFNCKATHCLKQQFKMTLVTEPLLPHPLPECLYCVGENHLILPGTLLSAYKSELSALGINPDVQPEEKRTGPIGGKDEKATNEHFSQAFNGSCARVQLAVLNPNKKESFISDVFIEAMCGGSVAFIDIPCGCGASFISVLTVIAELRRESILPRQPLKIRLVAGDISPSALSIAERTGETQDRHIMFDTK